MFDRLFWKLAVERAVKSAAQTAVLVLGAGAVDVFTVDWRQTAGLAAGAAVLSVLTSIGSEPFGPEGDPSVVN